MFQSITEGLNLKVTPFWKLLKGTVTQTLQLYLFDVLICSCQWQLLCSRASKSRLFKCLAIGWDQKVKFGLDVSNRLDLHRTRTSIVGIVSMTTVSKVFSQHFTGYKFCFWPLFNTSGFQRLVHNTILVYFLWVFLTTIRKQHCADRAGIKPNLLLFPAVGRWQRPLLPLRLVLLVLFLSFWHYVQCLRGSQTEANCVWYHRSPSRG